MITSDRLRMLHVVIDLDPQEPGNVIVAQAGLGAGGILQRAGFLPDRRDMYRHPSDAWETTGYRLPAGLTRDQRNQAASTAADALRRAGFTVDLHGALDVPVEAALAEYGTELGHHVNALAEQLRTAATTTEVAALLAELSAPGDGVIHALHNALDAAAGWAAELAMEHDGLSGVAELLAGLASDADDLGGQLSRARSVLVGNFRPHPLRSGTVPDSLPDPRMVAGPHPDLTRPWTATSFGRTEHAVPAHRTTEIESQEFYDGLGDGGISIDWHYATSELGYLLAGATDHRAGIAMHITDEDGIVTVSETFPSTAAATAAGPRFIETFEPLTDAPAKVLATAGGQAKAAASHARGPACPGGTEGALGSVTPTPASCVHHR